MGGREGRGFLSALRKYWISRRGPDVDEEGSDGPRRLEMPTAHFPSAKKRADSGSLTWEDKG